MVTASPQGCFACVQSRKKGEGAESRVHVLAKALPRSCHPCPTGQNWSQDDFLSLKKSKEESEEKQHQEWEEKEENMKRRRKPKKTFRYPDSKGQTCPKELESQQEEI